MNTNLKDFSVLELYEICSAMEIRLEELDKRLAVFSSEIPLNDFAVYDTKKQIDTCVKLMDRFSEMKERFGK